MMLGYTRPDNEHDGEKKMDTPGTSLHLSMAKRMAHLLPAELVAGLDAAAIAALEAELAPVHVAAGDPLFRQNDPGDSLYVLIQGRMTVSVQTADGVAQIIDELAAPTMIGELALLTGQTRTATVCAITDCELAQLSAAAYTRLVACHPTAVTHLAHASIPRLQRTQLVGIVTGLFGSVSAAALHDIQRKLQWRYLPSGAVLFRQGDPGDALYLVLSGRLKIVVADAGSERVLGEVGRGESVGEWALITGEQRTATVYAIRDTELVRLGHADFEYLLAHYPQLLVGITRLIVRQQQRLVVSVPRQHTPPTTFAVLPISSGVPLAEFARRLSDALARHGLTLYVDSAACEQAVGQEGIAQIDEDHPLRSVLVSWLNEQEGRYRSIVYVADPHWSAWTMRCVRQADRVLLVAQAGADPALGEIEARLQQLAPRTHAELVLLHGPTVKQPHGTGRWLAERQVHTHHHMRLHEPADVQRLARWLTGRALGLVLGSGGARGYAHIGVLRALEEAGLAIDSIGGTSMGALIGACYALGMDAHAIMERIKRFGAPQALLDYTVPLVSFFASKKLTRMLATLFEDVQIEDLWQPFFCVSSNLTQATSVVHRRGSLWKAIRSSVAIPCVFSPVVENNELLVDGSLLNYLPVEPMRELVANGPVIAVNVSVTHDHTHQYAFDTSVSGWQVLWHKLNPWAQPLPVPSIFATLVRSSEVAGIAEQEAKRRGSDLFIAPPVSHFTLLDFRPVEAIAARGYQAAQEALAAWQRSEAYPRFVGCAVAVI